MSTRVCLWWLRQDLRLADNAALSAAARRGAQVVPVFVHAPQEEGEWAPGGASRWWLNRSLESLDRSLREVGSRLVLRAGPSVEVLQQLVRETGADAVYWNRRYEPAAIARDRGIKSLLREQGVEVKSFAACLLHEPPELKNRAGGPYRVFTPFWKACLSKLGIDEPLPAPAQLAAPEEWPASLALSDLQLDPEANWGGGLRSAWQPGEKGAQILLKQFCDQRVCRYDKERDRPDLTTTSELSAHLHYGEFGPRQIWHAIGERSPASQAYLRQLGWREFAHHLLFHFPNTVGDPLRSDFNAFPWIFDRSSLKAWQRGLTGYPLVDAGMRQLWQAGWMHNRVRMVAASFLVKHLLVDWRHGARWFWDTLVDADLANNTFGWQWTAGCGADAAPYFRIFNPVKQGQRFDPHGRYVRRWLPELGRLPEKWTHQPWAAPAPVLEEAGVALGTTYPEPIVDHGFARERALRALAKCRSRARSSAGAFNATPVAAFSLTSPSRLVV